MAKVTAEDIDNVIIQIINVTKKRVGAKQKNIAKCKSKLKAQAEPVSIFLNSTSKIA